MIFETIRPEPAIDIREIRVFRAENFPPSRQVPWLVRPDWSEHVERLLQRGDLSAQTAQLCTHWAEHGYVIIPQMFSADVLDAAWADYERQIAAGTLKPVEGSSANSPLPERVLNPHFSVPAFKAILQDSSACNVVSLLLGAKSLPFQTIAGHKASEQQAHSDSIHMTTYPQGYLIANWIAFEDIAPDSGPLQFYPGSHRLPYAYSRDCGIGVEEARLGYGAYHAKYETFVQREIEQNHLKPAYFNAKKGDVLFWHANLLNGGSRIQNPNRSSHALICHYFAEGCICYHDYNGTPSHLIKFPFLEPEHFHADDYLRLNPDVAAAGIDAYTHYRVNGFREGRRVR